MAQELMLPLSRRDYFDGLFKATALNASISWVFLLAMIFTYLAIVSPQSLSLATSPAIAAVSAAVFLYCYGAVPWVALKTSTAGRFGLALLFYLPAVGVLTIGFREAERHRVVAWLAAALAAIVGVALFRIGRRRWLDVELGLNGSTP